MIRARERRVRTWSSDSGCDPGLVPLEAAEAAAVGEDVLRTWTDLMEAEVEKMFHDLKEIIHENEGET